MDATKPLYDAYVTEQNKAEVTSDCEFEVASSNVLVEYRRLEEAATQAANSLSRLTPPFESAKRNHDDAVRTSKTTREKLEDRTKELKKVADLEIELRKQILAVRQNIEATFSDFRVAANDYATDARGMTWLDASRNSIGLLQDLLNDPNTMAVPATTFSFERSMKNPVASTSLKDLRRDAERLENAISSMQKDKAVADQELKTLSTLRKESLRRRCQMLLDQSVSSELEFD